MKKIYLVDVSSIFFRSFYAIRQLNNTKGIPTNALYGFLTATIKLLKEHKPDALAFCFDLPDDGFREEIYKDYKANRSEAPSELVAQFPYLKKLAEALNVPSFEKSGFEADDLIGTLAEKSKRQGCEVVIVSGDKDFAQLVEVGVKIFDPGKDAWMGEDEVKAKFGVLPSQIIDYLSLVGDSSDNVPGVDGVGPKAAQKLLGEFQTLDGIYERIEDVKNERLKEKLTLQKDQAYLSKKLVTIVRDIPLDVTPESLKLKPVNKDKLIPLLQELEFKTLQQRLLGSESTPESVEASSTASSVEASETSSNSAAHSSNKKFVLIHAFSVEDFEKKFLEEKNEKELWLDISSSGTALLFGSSVVKYEGNIEALNQWVETFITTNEVSLCAYDVKGLAHLLNLKSEKLKTVGQDVMLQAYCLGFEGDKELKSLIKIYLDKDLPELVDGAEKLQMIWQLSKKLDDEIKKHHVEKVLKKIELPLIPVLFHIEKEGVLIHKEQLHEYSSELKKQTRDLEKEIFKLAGQEFNVGSPKQLGQILFTKLGLPVVRKTKTGFSTDSDVLEKLKDQNPICDFILNWRELTKLNSTYVEALPHLINPQTGRVHTTYNQAVTSTGRLSSIHPNIQNIPIRTQRGMRIRNSFIAPEGFKILSADYSQVELRVLAHITKDPGLMRAFEKDQDIHTVTASEVFEVPPEDVSSDQRRTAKAINFGIVYGMSDFGLAENLGVDRTTAADFIKKYFGKYGLVKKYMNDVVQQGIENGFVQTLFGRRRYYSGLKSTNRNIRQMAERAAINMPIQGTAADIIKLAMIKIDQELPQAFPNSKMIMQVHDELVFEVKEEDVESFKPIVQKWMSETTPLRVPLKVEVEVGDHW